MQVEHTHLSLLGGARLRHLQVVVVAQDWWWEQSNNFISCLQVTSKLLFTSHDTIAFICLSWFKVPQIRLQKCRPYVVNLLPLMSKIAKRKEENVHETLADSLPKIFAILGKGAFINDVTQIWPKIDPPPLPSVTLKWLLNWQLSTECHTLQYPPPSPYLRDVIYVTDKSQKGVRLHWG